MHYILLLKGVLIGFILASPFGPIGLVFIQRSLESDKLEGIASGIGIASGDMFYSIISTLGVTFLYNYIIDHIVILQIIAFFALLFLAIRTLKAKVSFHLGEEHKRNIFKSFGVSFLLALHNPSTIVLFAFLFGLFDIGEIMTKSNAFLLVLGIYCGSIILWTILNHFIQKIKKTNRIDYLHKFYKLSGVLLLVISLALLYDLIALFAGWKGL